MAGETRSEDALRVLSRDEVRALYATDPGAVVQTTAGTWALILSSLTVWATYPTWAVFAVAFLVIATRQHALNNLVHEAAHYSISRNKVLNGWISDVLYATPHLINTEGYRKKHLMHHAALGDPILDTEVKPRYLITGWNFWKRFALAMVGYEAYLAVRTYTDQPDAGTKQGLRGPILIVLTNGALFLYCWALGTPFAYFYLWLLPLFTLTMFISTLRVIAEHQPEEYARLGIMNADAKMPLFTRTITAGWMERFVFGPVNFCYHREHHLIPGVPFANLPKMHNVLRERGVYAADDPALAESYLGTLYNLVLPERTRPGTAAEPSLSRK
jgi:fatty acid desaturase